MSSVSLKKDGLDEKGEPLSFYQLEEHHHPEGSSTMLGFWMYLMSDCLIFAVLFAAYGVLGTSYAGGPTPKEIFELIIKADEKLKYATGANRELRRGQARDLLQQALDAAREVSNEALIAQAEQRMADLDAL